MKEKYPIGTWVEIDDYRKKANTPKERSIVIVCNHYNNSEYHFQYITPIQQLTGWCSKDSQKNIRTLESWEIINYKLEHGL